MYSTLRHQVSGFRLNAENVCRSFRDAFISTKKKTQARSACEEGRGRATCVRSTIGHTAFQSINTAIKVDELSETWVPKA
jgi:hypothetical protein